MAKHKKKRNKAKASTPADTFDNNGKAQYAKELRPNPYAYGDGNRVRNSSLTVNRRCSPIVEYYNRQRLTYDQATAGLEFERIYALSKSTTQAIDYSNEPVDTSGAPDAFTDSRIAAINRLIRCRDILGLTAYQLIEQVCGHGVYVKDIAPNDYKMRQEMENLRHCLTVLALHW